MNDTHRVADGPQNTPTCCFSCRIVIYQEHKGPSSSGFPCSSIYFLDGHSRARFRPIRPNSIPVPPRIGKKIRIGIKPAVYVTARPIPPFCFNSLRPGFPDLQAAYQIGAHSPERCTGQGSNGTEPQITAHSRRVQQLDAFDSA